MTEQQKNNLALWNRVEKTDPAHTKKVQLKQRRYTTVDAQYQLKNATAEFGQYGDTWGVRECKYDYLRDAKGEILEAMLDAVFYYPGGAFEISTDAKYRVNGDTRKKLLTDLTTKALSKLGFNADVFMGRFDDNKYVEEVDAEYRREEHAAAKATLDDKRRVLAAVSEYLKKNSCTADPAKFIQDAARTVVKKEHCETNAELDEVHRAIVTGQFPLPQQEAAPAA